ncbi:hypothetical protein [Modestobacter sp. NPDC049651]|uniref:hypothetical protein n=1 Tax=unclassified Modestobacter TaxID=2643866 RepID=UPI0033EDF1F2
MTSELLTLGLQPAVHTHDVRDGRVVRHPRSYFLDFLVDGVSFSNLAHVDRNLVTALNRSVWADISGAVETLLGRRPAPYLDAGRIPLLVCGSCGELECGAVTAALHVGATEVTWSDFRWDQGNISGPEPIDSLCAPLRFDRVQYGAELADVGLRVADLPDDEPLFSRPPHRGRRLRWPWQRSEDDRRP